MKQLYLLDEHGCFDFSASYTELNWNMRVGLDCSKQVILTRKYLFDLMRMNQLAKRNQHEPPGRFVVVNFRNATHRIVGLYVSESMLPQVTRLVRWYVVCTVAQQSWKDS